MALTALGKCDLVARGERLDVYMDEFDCMVGSETEHARRKRDYRIRQQTLLEYKNGTLSEQCLTEVSSRSEQSLIEKEIEKEKEKESDSQR